LNGGTLGAVIELEPLGEEKLVKLSDVLDTIVPALKKWNPDECDVVDVITEALQRLGGE